MAWVTLALLMGRVGVLQAGLFPQLAPRAELSWRSPERLQETMASEAQLQTWPWPLGRPSTGFRVETGLS